MKSNTNFFAKTLVFCPTKYKQYPKYRRQETKKKNEIKYIGPGMNFYDGINNYNLVSKSDILVNKFQCSY